jgi:hypothetical protein
VPLLAKVSNHPDVTRPRNATGKNGVTWADWGPVGSVGWLIRWVTVGPEWAFEKSPHQDNLDWETDLASTNYNPDIIGRNNRSGFLGEYQPIVHYMTRKEFEALGDRPLSPEDIPEWRWYRPRPQPGGRPLTSMAELLEFLRRNRFHELLGALSRSHIWPAGLADAGRDAVRSWRGAKERQRVSGRRSQGSAPPIVGGPQVRRKLAVAGLIAVLVPVALCGVAGARESPSSPEGSPGCRSPRRLPPGLYTPLNWPIVQRRPDGLPLVRTFICTSRRSAFSWRRSRRSPKRRRPRSAGCSRS